MQRRGGVNIYGSLGIVFAVRYPTDFAGIGWAAQERATAANGGNWRGAPCRTSITSMFRRFYYLETADRRLLSMIAAWRRR